MEHSSSDFSFVSLKALEDNYIYLLLDNRKQKLLVVDAGTAEPVVQWLKQNPYELSGILNTHHHADHTAGNIALQQQFKCPIYAPAYDLTKGRIPYDNNNLVHAVKSGDEFDLLGFEFKILPLPGHTLGHIGYYLKKNQWLFSGDTLFSMGCGYLFEGSTEIMWQSLEQILALPPETLIFATHEYTKSNGIFLQHYLKQNFFHNWNLPESIKEKITDRWQQVLTLTAQQMPTVPTALSLEKDTNPFLWARWQPDPAMAFAQLRKMKNEFKIPIENFNQ